MKKIIITLIFGLFGASVFAQNPFAAKFVLDAKTKGEIVLNISMVQSELHQALTKRFPDKDFGRMEKATFGKLAMDYLKQTSRIWCDGTQLDYAATEIELDGQHIALKLLVNNYQEGVSKLDVEISSLSESSDQHTVFLWQGTDFTREKILDGSNNFSARLHTVEPPQKGAIWSNLFPCIICLVTGLPALIGLILLSIPRVNLFSFTWHQLRA